MLKTEIVYEIWLGAWVCWNLAQNGAPIDLHKVRTFGKLWLV